MSNVRGVLPAGWGGSRLTIQLTDVGYVNWRAALATLLQPPPQRTHHSKAAHGHNAPVPAIDFPSITSNWQFSHSFKRYFDLSILSFFSFLSSVTTHLRRAAPTNTFAFRRPHVLYVRHPTPSLSSLLLALIVLVPLAYHLTA